MDACVGEEPIAKHLEAAEVCVSSRLGDGVADVRQLFAECSCHLSRALEAELVVVALPLLVVFSDHEHDVAAEFGLEGC